MLLRKNHEKHRKEIENGYNNAIQFLLDNNIHFNYLTCSIWIKFYKKEDAVKLLKYLYKNEKIFYYSLSIPYKTKHSYENKIFFEDENIHHFEYYYIYE